MSPTPSTIPSAIPSATGAPLPPFRKLNWLPRAIAVQRRADGVIVLASRFALQPYEAYIPAMLARWAQARPDQTWLAQRKGAGRQWQHLRYADAKRRDDSLTQALLNRGLPPGRPVAILSGNSLENALMTMAAMQARLPVAPISAAYSLLSQDHAKLKYLFALVQPALVLVQDGLQFQKALNALDLTGFSVVHVDRAPEGIPSFSFEAMTQTPVTPAVAESITQITPETVGKLLFTSGSTGMPKAVINTQRMMCANVAQARQARNSAGDRATVVLDWMPWNHTMGGNALFNAVLGDGGTLYIDDGRPLPGLFDETLRNLREVSPSYCANPPSGYAALAAARRGCNAGMPSRRPTM